MAESEEIEKVKRGRRRRRRRESAAAAAEAEAAVAEAEVEARDPATALGPDVMERVLGALDARSVARSAAVSRAWHGVATSDRLWAPKAKSVCKELWKGKAHIPRLSMLRGASRMAIYSLAVMDGKRTRVVKDDLCDHVWEYRFKKTAPEYWRNLDPSWKGTGPPMRRYFQLNGSHTADPDDKVWGGHECTFSIVTSYVGDGKIREHYVRINRWPPMRVARKEDWSWEMSNNLYVYNSLPDAGNGVTGPLFPVW